MKIELNKEYWVEYVYRTGKAKTITISDDKQSIITAMDFYPWQGDILTLRPEDFIAECAPEPVEPKQDKSCEKDKSFDWRGHIAWVYVAAISLFGAGVVIGTLAMMHR
jgi:hypothetical protein